MSSLRTRITVQQRAVGVDALGQPLDAWQDVAAGIWADVRHTSGVQTAQQGGGESSTVRASARIRQREGLTPRMRVLIGSTVYDITAVIPDLQTRQHVDLTLQMVQ
ncbi:MAG: hypothetical protein RIQ53_4168 [Pseudomonadota bacterium]|jgi:SPP1 family predicted phage head-tail adaptor